MALAAVGLAACGGGGHAAPKASPTTTYAAPVTTKTVPVGTTTPPPTTAPPETTTTAPPVFPPTNLNDAQNLANTADMSNVMTSRSGGNDSASCPNPKVMAIVPNLGSQAMAAVLLNIFFAQSESNPGGASCGGVSIDAYFNQSQESSNSATAGEATAGNVQLIISSRSNYQVIVDVGSATDPTVQFNFSY